MRCMAWTSRRGAMLIEAVVVVVLIGLSVPPLLSVVSEAAESRADTVRAAEATMLAQGVMEQILADVYVRGIGVSVLDDAETYVDGAGEGLRSRMAWMLEPAAERRFAVDVRIGSPVGPMGFPTGDADRDVFRIVTVGVSFTSTRGQSELSISSMVTDLGEAP